MGVTGYPRQNRGMSLDLIESSLGCPLGNWDPWGPWDPDIPDMSKAASAKATKEGLNPDGSFKLSTLNMGRWSCFSRFSVLGKHAVYDEPLEVNEQV